MKKEKIVYWIATSLVVVAMLTSGFSYLTAESMKSAFQHIGFPDYFRIELGIAKILGALILLLPVSGRIREWSYAGFGITFISAFVAHISSGDSIEKAVPPLILFSILAVSYIYNNKVAVLSRR